MKNKYNLGTWFDNSFTQFKAAELFMNTTHTKGLQIILTHCMQVDLSTDMLDGSI